MIYFSNFDAGGGGGGPVVTLKYTNNTNYNFANVGGSTVTLDPGDPIAADEILLVFVETSNEAMPVPTTNGAATFTEVTNLPLANGTSSTRLTLFESSPTDGTETILTYGDSGDHQIGAIIRVIGSELPGGSAVHAIGATGSSTTVTSITLPSVTTTIDNCIILGVAAQANFGGGHLNTWVNSSLTGVSDFVRVADGAGNNGALGAGRGTLATAGSSGTFTATSDFASWIGAQFAIR